MSTFSTQMVRDFAVVWDNSLDYPSSVFSGIIGNLAHLATGGYHISIEDQVNPNNYSVVRPDDKAPPGDWPRNMASAVDMSMSVSDMVKCWDRMYAVWADVNDPRRIYMNAVNGWNGVGTAERLDFVANTRSFASDDHKGHNHLEFRRRYVNSPVAMNAVLSMLRGESKADYIASISGGRRGIGMFRLQKQGDPAIWLIWPGGKLHVGPWSNTPLQNAGIPLVTVDQSGWDQLINVADNPGGSFKAILDGVISIENKPAAVFTSAQIAQLAEDISAGIVVNPDTPLGDADKPAIKAALQEILPNLRLGTV